MRIRFLTMLDSGVEGFPFMPGQVIEVAKPSPWLLSYVDGERAEQLADVEVAIEPAASVTAPPVADVTSAPAIEAAVTTKGRKGRS